MSRHRLSQKQIASTNKKDFLLLFGFFLVVWFVYLLLRPFIFQFFDRLPAYFMGPT